MTISDQRLEDQRTEKWKPIPGCSGYEASDNSVWRLGGDWKLVQVSGGIRSIDRVDGRGRNLTGVLLKGRLNGAAERGDRYVVVNLTDDEGRKVTRLAHRLILLAHVGECPEDQETLHSKRGPLWCRVPEDIRYGTRAQNLIEWKENNPAKPKPVKRCVRCEVVMAGNGRRCHECVVEIGQEAAALLRSGVKLGDAASQLEYPSVEGLHTLAVKYGGYGIERPRWTQRVAITLRGIFGGSDGK